MIIWNELDRIKKIALISEKIMRWEHLKVGYFEPITKWEGYVPCEPRQTDRQVELADWLKKVGVENVGDYLIKVEEEFAIDIFDFNVCEDKNATFKIVNKLAEEGFQFELQQQKENIHATFYNNKNSYSSTVELDSKNNKNAVNDAICITALKTLGLNIKYI